MAEEQVWKNDDQEPFVLVDRVVSPYIATFHQPSGLQAEQFRGLRNQITAMNKSGSARSIMVTSAVKGEGKSISLVNLAITLGELERTRVLIIEADLRHPSIETLIGINQESGLSELLRDQCDLDEVIRPSGFPQVDLLSAGQAVETPGRLLVTSRMNELLGAMKERYRYILIDSPPVIPVTDALSLGPKADGVLMVIRLDYTPRPAVERAIEQLRGVGSAVLGSFLNCVPAISDGQSSYSYGVQDRDQ